ncbi:fructose 1,6-bisphosphatase [Candidatus Bathyarchaeota archaeon]|nr:fructose 1,6-bisphosphatase [Candidatus Bathyarchaeota archaeon]
MKDMTTISVIKADVGSLAGHHVVHPKQLEVARERLERARRDELLVDFHVTHCGDDLQLIMSHRMGENNTKIHELAWATFTEVTEKVSRPLKLYAAGQDLLAEAFSGNVRGMGPGAAELEFQERASDPIVILLADKTSPGAWNLPLYKIFADPFNTAGLVIDPVLHNGFSFDVLDTHTGLSVRLRCPEELYDLLALIGDHNRYVISKVFRKDGLPSAAASTARLSMIAGRYVGKDDPVCIVRAQSGLPAVGEVLEPFAFPHLVPGWMRGSHHGPLMPVSVSESQNKCTRFDGPPRVVALGFQVSNARLVGPSDLFADPAFDTARTKASEIAYYMRAHGPFIPHRLGPEEMEYTTLPSVLEKLKDRFQKAE